MKPLKVLATHGEWTLRQRDNEFMVQRKGAIVSTSRNDGHELDLVRLALARISTSTPRILVGGLGFGLLLRALLDDLGDGAQVTVLEPSEAVRAWNEGPLAALHDDALHDARVRVESGDALIFLSKHRAKFDAVLLDIDAGPFDVDIDDDTSLYSIGGFSSLRASLDKGGRLAIASRTTQPGINKRLRECGFQATAEKVNERFIFTGDV